MAEKKDILLHQEVVATWNTYQENGLHVSAAQVLAWLDTWGDEVLTDAPVCHE